MRKLQHEVKPSRPKAPPARRSAAAVVRAPAASPNHRDAGPLRSASPTSPFDVASVVEQARRAPRGPLPHAARVARDLGLSPESVSPNALEVRRGEAARAACERLGASAFAVQNVVVFAESSPGLRRVRHELAHVLQQGGLHRPAPNHFVPGSLTLSAPGSQPELEAAAFARDADSTALGRGPVMVCRNEITSPEGGDDEESEAPAGEVETKEETRTRGARARGRLETLARSAVYRPAPHDKDAPRFGISNGVPKKEKFDPVFVVSSTGSWRVKQYQESEGISLKAAKKDLTSRIFKRVGNESEARLAEYAVARKAIAVDKQTFVWAVRVVSKNVATSDEPDALTTRYTFVGHYWKEGKGEIKHPATEGEIIPPDLEIVNETFGKPRSTPDPSDSLTAYAKIVDDIEAEAKAHHKELTLTKELRDAILAAQEAVKLPSEATGSEAATPPPTEPAAKPLTEEQREEKAGDVRVLLKEWILKNYTKVTELYAQIFLSKVFPPAYNAIKGDVWVEYVGKTPSISGVAVQTNQVIFGTLVENETELKVKKSGDLDALRRGDGIIKVDSEEHILEGKVRASSPSADELEQMGDYAKIVKLELPGYIVTDGVPGLPHTFTAVEYYVVAPEPAKQEAGEGKGEEKEKSVAKAWNEALKTAFTGVKGGYRIHPNVDKDPELWVTIKVNPLLTLPIRNPQQVDQTVENVPAKQPGVTIKRADFKLARPLEAEIASGTLLLAIDMQGAVVSKDEAKPKPIVAIPATEAKPEKPGGPIVYGRVDNEFAKLRSSLDNFFKERVRTDAKLVDDGVEASLWITPGKSGIPGIHLDEAVVTATLGKRGLKAEGKLGLSNAKGTVKGGLVVTWSATANQWGVKGSVTFTDLIDGLKPITAHFEYDAAKDTTRIWAEKVEILKKYGGITLYGWATGLEYNVDDGEFSGTATLTAELGAFGKASGTARVEKNRLVGATIEYQTQRLKVPKGTPALEGQLAGTLTYTAPTTPDGKPTFSGRIDVDAEITAAVLKKLSKDSRLAVGGFVEILPNGSFRGAFETRSPISLGKHFLIPGVRGTVDEKGEIAVLFALEVVNIGLLKDARARCVIDRNGFDVLDANVFVTVGTKKDRVWGELGVIYERGTGLTVGGDINLRIKDGMVAFGRALYNSETGKVDAQLGVKKIPLLHHGPERHPIFGFSKQVELISFFKIVGVYLDVGFELAFVYDFGLDLEPTLFVRGLSFNDFSFVDVRARMKLSGHMTASLEAAPSIGLGIFVISASVLRGGGGVRVPVVGKASLMLEPPLTVDVIYSNEGGVSAGGTVGLTLLFGITASIKPYAEIYVLSLWHPQWEWGPIHSVTLLEERPIFTYVVDFGKPLKEETEPAFPTGKEAPAKPSAAKSFASEQTGSAPEKKHDEISTVEQNPIEKKPPATNDAGFDLAAMVDKAKDHESFRPIREIIEIASYIFDVLKILFGPLIRLVKWLVGGVVELVQMVLRTIRQYGALVPAVREFLKARLHPVVFNIVSPMLDLLGTVENDIYDLFDLKLPTSVGEMLTFSFTILKKALKLAWDSLSGLVRAIRDTISAVGDAVNYFLDLLVQKGRIGARRHVRYIGSETLGLAHYFLLPDEYKVIDVGGFSIGPKEDDDWYPDADKAVAFGLWFVLHESSVRPTYNAIDPDTGDPYENYWVSSVERKARRGGALRLTPMVLEAVYVAAATSESEPLPLSIQRRLQTVPTPELSAIRIHTDDASAAAAEALDAHAFTVGHDIYFGAGEYRPWTPEGERLLVHEVAHATWEARASWPRYGDRMSVAGDDRERQADAFADALLSSGSTRRT